MQGGGSVVIPLNECKSVYFGLKPVSNMVDNFVRSLSTANDSGSFDTSLEIKSIQQHSQRKRSKCVTELDREELLNFVRKFEERHKTKSPKRLFCKNKLTNTGNSTFLEDSFIKRLQTSPNDDQNGQKLSSKKQKVNGCDYKLQATASSTPIKESQFNKSKTLDDTLNARKLASIIGEEAETKDEEDTLAKENAHVESSQLDSDFESLDPEFYEINTDSQSGNEEHDISTNLDATVYEFRTPKANRSSTSPLHFEFRRCYSFKRPDHVDKQCKTARILQFFSSARKKNKQNLCTKSCSTSRSGSPISIRSANYQSGCRLFAKNYDTDDDDGNSTFSQPSTTSSHNMSADSSLELQAPILPSFKVTPPPSMRGKSNAAYELAKILRGSFKSRKASITTLRRSLSDPENCRQDECEIPKKSSNDLIQLESSVKVGLGTAMIRNLDLICSRALPAAESPFRRWGQSSFRSPRSNDQRNQLARRPSSLAASESDVYTKSIDDFGDDFESRRSESEDINGLLANQIQNEANGSVESWGASFEKLLDDPSGLHTFAEFLKKEFSAENIYFWTACERYRQMNDEADRAACALNIFSKHLASGAPEPVNIDSQARNTAEENLHTADRNIFAQAQKQIFNLMKFDSYQRFIRSDLYKKCLEAESKNQPLPYPGDQLDELLRTNLVTLGSVSKLKKSLSNAEDRRRKSLLPWHRKTRCKSRDRGEREMRGNKSSTKAGSSLKTATSNNSTSDIHSSRSSLSSFDVVGNGSDDAKACSLCRVILCDGATTIVQTRQNETVRQLVDRLLEKRGIHYECYEVILSGNTKAFDLENPSTMLAGKEVQIEQKVAFKLDLPDPKVISVKCKPKKALGDVLKPILHKYNYHMSDVQVLFRDSHEILEMNLPVTVADGQRLQVVLTKSDGWAHDNNAQHLQQRSVNQTNLKHPQIPTTTALYGPKNGNGKTPSMQQSTLDEITNKVFNELLQGKVDSHSNQPLLPKASDQSSLKSEECESESSSIFGRLRRRDSNAPGGRGLKAKKATVPNKNSVANSEEGSNTCSVSNTVGEASVMNIKKPLIAKWKTGVKLQVTGRTETAGQDELLEGLKRAQRARLEDQRGTEINFELPDFLKDKENLNAVSKLRKTRGNIGPINSKNGIGTSEPIPSVRNSLESVNNSISTTQHSSPTEKPQPAPRLSIAKTNGSSIGAKNTLTSTPTSPVSPTNPITSTRSISSSSDTMSINGSSSSLPKAESNRRENEPFSVDSPTQMTINHDVEYDLSNSKGPPPLPPKPKILPIKPSNWGQAQPAVTSCSQIPSKIPIDITRRHLSLEPTARNIYLDQPSSSFV